jgi:hypothetical protein
MNRVTLMDYWLRDVLTGGAHVAPVGPKCELYAGKKHDDNPPEARARVALFWTVRATGETRKGEKDLCEECLGDKLREFAEIRGNVERLVDYGKPLL